LAFFAELKRRRVFRVALVYAGAAWAMAQVADVLEPVLNLPEWTVPMVLFLLILGFPIAMVLAWAFDIGPSGIETTPTISRIGPLRVAIYMFLLLVATAGMVFLIKPGLFSGTRSVDTSQRWQDQDRQAEQALYDSVAVLPFENLSDDPNNDHIGSGIAEEMRNSLSRVPDLKVAGRTSSLQMAAVADDIQAIGEKLGVSTIIQGTVRRSGDELRITVQLVDTQSGFQIWSEAYDRRITDLVAVQRELSEQILEELQGDMPAIMLHLREIDRRRSRIC
jgi:TolB-like protein